MKLLKFMLPFVVASHGFSVLAADEGAFSTTIEARERDVQAVQDYINTKRAVSVQEKGGDLRISGDIRTEYSHLKCKTDGIKQRGHSTINLYPNDKIKKSIMKNRQAIKAAKLELANAESPQGKKDAKKKIRDSRSSIKDTRLKLRAPYPTTEFDIEANLVFDYVADRGWGTLRLQMSNPAGIAEIDRKLHINDSRNILFGSGKLSNFAVRKAFMGYNVWEQGNSRFDVELGRRRLGDTFDSQIQFYSIFDGVLAKFSSTVEGFTDFYAKAAAFVVDQNTNHWAYVAETGLTNIADLGLDVKYSLIHWGKHGENRYGKKRAAGNRFLNSQITAAYTVSPDLLRLKTQVYGAYLINHAAKATSWTHYKKANEAFYAGVRVGDVVKKGDCAVDVTYQWVQAQAISERDLSGMGRDNPRGISFHNKRWGGFSNYKGYKVDTFYAVTDNWTLNAYFQNVHQQNKRIGGKHHSSELSIAAIFAF